MLLGKKPILQSLISPEISGWEKCAKFRKRWKFFLDIKAIIHLKYLRLKRKLLRQKMKIKIDKDAAIFATICTVLMVIFIFHKYILSISGIIK